MTNPVWDTIEFRYKVMVRVEAIMRIAPNPDLFSDYELLALQWMFSNLYALEGIAVLSAQRGDGVEDQLADEWFHRDAFKELATIYGGLKRPCKEIRDLVNFLQNMQGPIAKALINVVAENWLEVILGKLKKSIFKAIFQVIEDDEHRHVELAKQELEVEGPELLPSLTMLEEMLYRVGNAPTWVMPINFLFGYELLSDIGIHAIHKHREACEAIGVKASNKLVEMVKDAKIMRRMHYHNQQNRVTLTTLNNWEKGAPYSWPLGYPDNIAVLQEIQCPYRSPIRMEAYVASLVSEVLAEHDDLRRTERRCEVVGWKTPMIGIRKTHLKGEIFTVYAESPHKMPIRQLIMSIGAKEKRALEKEYPPVYDFKDVIPLLPHARCQVVISYNGHYGVETGWPALVEAEGFSCSIVIGKPKPLQGRGFTVNLGIVATHKVWGGVQIGKLASGLKTKSESYNGVTENY